ncbi:MAG: TA system VapC family ribonuclease toxin [Acidimicrobiales bacterium]
MSTTLDVNILVYATHTASPFHQRARALVSHLVAGPSLTYIFWPVILGYLRIVTHSTILETPLSSDDAMSNVESLISPAHIRVAGEVDDFWTAFRRVTAPTKPRGKLVPDAHLVTLMHVHGVSTIWSNDRDFRKFDAISARNPFDDRYSAGFG